MRSNLSEARNRLLALIKAAQAGEDVVIANRGAPVARLVPVEATATARSDIGAAKAILLWLKTYPLPAYTRRSAQEIDAAIEEERRAWD